MKMKTAYGKTVNIEMGSVWTKKDNGAQVQISMLNGRNGIVGFPNRSAIDEHSELSIDAFLSLYEPGSRVSEIRFEIKTKSGGHAEAVFVREVKIADLLADPGSLGAFLQDLLRTIPQKSKK